MIGAQSSPTLYLHCGWLIRRAVVLAVAHPAQLAKTMLDVKHIHHNFHWWFVQIPDLPEQALTANDFAFVDYLWDYWTSPGYRDAAHIAEIKRMLSEPNALTATLNYYRAHSTSTKSIHVTKASGAPRIG